MTKKLKPGPATPAAKRVSRAVKSEKSGKEAAVKAKKAAAKAKAPVKAKPAAAKAAKAKPVAEDAPKRVKKTAPKGAAVAKETKARTKAPAAQGKKKKERPEESTATNRMGDAVLDPIGDVTSGEARTYLGEAERQAEMEMEAFRADTATAAMDSGMEAGRGLEATQAAIEARARKAAEEAAAQQSEREESSEEEAGTLAHEPAKLERLQKILSQAGIASRRHAEEMIVAGRVMVNGQVVTTLGSKADPARDHIRVDGKLLQGAERHRYFELNKPKGFVTTVSDPEGRPTVMQFFEKMHARLYPVGRLDYQSEGLLLMTNDGELANLLTKAGSGVEKTYLVKVAGQPSEEELERLRNGVTIERGEAGSERVKTSPARIRQVREGDNPWYEVVLTEGRNRELRKMFSAVGHFVEKIRRVGYGPLVLDVEPGEVRELAADEVNALRLTAEGKMKPRRTRIEKVLPKEAGRAAVGRGDRRADRGGRPPKQDRGAFRQRNAGEKKREWQPRDRGLGGGAPRSEFEGGEKGREFRRGGAAPFGKRGGSDFGARPRFDRPQNERPFSGAKPRFDRAGVGDKPKFDRPRFAGGPPRSGATDRPRRFEARPGGSSGGQRPFNRERPFSGAKPRFDQAGVGDKPRFDRPGFTGGPPRGGATDRPKRFEGRPDRSSGGARPFNRQRPFSGAKPRFDRAGFADKPRFDRPKFEGRQERKPTDRQEVRSGQSSERSFGDTQKKSWGGRPAMGRPNRSPGGNRGSYSKPRPQGKPGGGGRGSFRPPNRRDGGKRG